MQYLLAGLRIGIAAFTTGSSFANGNLSDKDELRAVQDFRGSNHLNEIQPVTLTGHGFALPAAEAVPAIPAGKTIERTFTHRMSRGATAPLAAWHLIPETTIAQANRFPDSAAEVP